MICNSHCLYGLDGDLLLLSLATHEPNFAILREKVAMRQRRDFRQSHLRAESMLQLTDEFQFVFMSILREYIAIDIGVSFSTLTGLAGSSAVAGADAELTASSASVVASDLERVIDDFVFLATLVGNGGFTGFEWKQ